MRPTASPGTSDGSTLALGLVGLPAISVAAGLAARQYADGPLRLTGPVATGVNCAVVVALIAGPYTAGAATLFYAAAMLVAAWRGQAGCEGTAISNWILRRDDQVGCPVFSPIDKAKSAARLRRSATRG